MYKTDPKDYPPPTGNSVRKTATIETTTGGGTFHSVDCPYCGKSMILGRELSTMMVYCRECCKTFNLRHADDCDASDDCERCHGSRGGVKGNENIVDGEVLCDDCHCDDLEYSDTQPAANNPPDDPPDDDKPDDGSNTPFNPPPATPKYPAQPYGDPGRGPINWPIHYDGRHD